LTSPRDHPADRPGHDAPPNVAALFSAIEAGDAAVVGRLIEADRSLLTARNQRGESPVLTACYRRKGEVIKLLLGAGPRLSVWEAAAAGQTGAVVAHLTRDRSLIAAYSHDGWTPLHLAAYFGHRDVVEDLLKRDASVDAWSKNGLANQPLHAAAAGGEVEVCRLLVEAGADVNARQHGAYSPLHEAAQNGNRPLVELLLDNGADRAARAVNGDTPAALAMKAGHSALAALLK
jgi:ankyrin repeat protein